MAVGNHVENPFEYILEKLSFSGGGLRRRPARAVVAAPQVRRIGVADLKAALREGMEDLGAVRADVLFIGVIYPIAGLLLLMAVSQQNLMPLAFPLVSGFALIGPIAAVGLYEISRRRERGEPVSMITAFEVLRAPALGSIIGVGLILLGLFLVWLAAAYQIYNATLGPWPPTSFTALLRAALTTSDGQAMTLVGCLVGAVFAVVAFALSVVSIPLLLDRDVGAWRAVATSVRAVAANPGTMALWGLIVAGLLILGSIPALVGLIVVAPLLGHATWRLYRKIVV
jgi:uncharacterized membrane protein